MVDFTKVTAFMRVQMITSYKYNVNIMYVNKIQLPKNNVKYN